MKLLKYSILLMLLWNFPGFLLSKFNSTLGSATSYLTVLLLLLYFFLNKKNQVIWPFLILGLFYFTIAGLNYTNDLYFFYIDFVKYIIVVICGVEVARRTSIKELFLFLMIGALSVIINSVFYPDNYGRYSGFYLNPNAAAAICIVGFSLSYAIKINMLKLIGQFIFTLAGFMTFSRHFILMWIVVNIISIFASRKNLVGIGLGALVIIILFTTSTALHLNTVRFAALKSIFSSEYVQTGTIEKDSRTKTWAKHYEEILNSPLIGSGYNRLQGYPGNGGFGIKEGVHNTFLMVIGEAGIIPFLIILWIYGEMILKGIYQFKFHPEYFLIAISLFSSLLVSHNYFKPYFLLFLSFYLFIKLEEKNGVVKI